MIIATWTIIKITIRLADFASFDALHVGERRERKRERRGNLEKHSRHTREKSCINRNGNHFRSRDHALSTRSHERWILLLLSFTRVLHEQTTRLSRYPLRAAASTFPSSRWRFHPRVPASVAENFPSSNTSSNPSSCGTKYDFSLRHVSPMPIDEK